MRGALGRAVVLAGVAVLIQACAGGMMESTPMATTAATGGSQGTQSYGIYGTDSYFKLEWGPDERRGKPLVSGYVTNQWGLTTKNVRLRVEALDAAGKVTATYIGYVNGYVNPGSHVYFEVPVETKAPSYRVTVLSFDPVQGHG
jgi:hypothetical protein